MATEYRGTFKAGKSGVRVEIKIASLDDANQWIKKWAGLSDARIESREIGPWTTLEAGDGK